jgi:hypothetical protein
MPLDTRIPSRREVCRTVPQPRSFLPAFTSFVRTCLDVARAINRTLHRTSKKGSFGRYDCTRYAPGKKQAMVWPSPCHIRLHLSHSLKKGASARANRSLSPTAPDRPPHHATSAGVPATGQRLSAPLSAAHLIVFPTTGFACLETRDTAAAMRDPAAARGQRGATSRTSPMMNTAYSVSSNIAGCRFPCSARGPSCSNSNAARLLAPCETRRPPPRELRLLGPCYVVLAARYLRAEGTAMARAAGCSFKCETAQEIGKKRQNLISLIFFSY